MTETPDRPGTTDRNVGVTGSGSDSQPPDFAQLATRIAQLAAGSTGYTNYLDASAIKVAERFLRVGYSRITGTPGGTRSAFDGIFESQLIDKLKRYAPRDVVRIADSPEDMMAEFLRSVCPLWPFC